MKTISVSGTGICRVPHAYAQVNVGVSTDGKTAVKAIQENNSLMAKVVNEAKQVVAERDMATTKIDLAPKYVYNNQKNENLFVGFSASNTITLKVREVPKVGELLDRLVAVGVNNINNINLLPEEKEALEAKRQARVLALQDAKVNAELYAATAGVKLGGLLEVVEPGASIRPQSNAKMAFAADLAGGGMPVVGGESDIVFTVSATYAIQD